MGETEDPIKRKMKRNNEDGFANESSSKKLKSFDAKLFRKQLQTENKLTALQSFLNEIQLNPSCVKSYLEKGGSCNELLQCLENDATLPPVVVFEVVTNVILQICTQLPQYQNAAYESCRYFLNTYLSLINKMLGLSSSVKERTIILNLLTSIVTYSATLAKEILLHVNFNPTNLELLTKHTEQRNKVRQAFIHFLTAYLVDGHYPTLSVLLEKRGLLTSIINGLKYDEADTVCIVLSAMKNHILENPYVYKTAKMRTFSTPVVRDIVNLYNWKGPAGFHASNKGSSTIEVDQYEKSKVSECVHDFLLVLCTSHKFGVIFKDPTVGLAKKNQNSLMYTVLESLDRPWEHSYAGQLVLKICSACPDLVKTMWNNLKEFIAPRLTTKWLNAMKFAKNLAEELQPSCIGSQVNQLDVQQLSQIICILVAPLPILRTLIAENNQYESQLIKHHILKLLLAFLKVVQTYINQCSAWFQAEDLTKLKNSLSLYVNKHFPDANSLLDLWHKADPPNEMNLIYDQLEYLNDAFELFEHYKTLAPNLLDSLNTDSFNFSNLLAEIKALLNEENSAKAKTLQVKVINVFLELDNSLLRPKSELFAPVLGLLFEYYYSVRDETTLSVISRVFKITGIFENCESEITIWINGILDMKKYDESVVDLILKSLVLTDEKILNFIEVINNALGVSEGNVRHQDLLELLSEDCIHANSKRLKHTNLSPLLVGFLQILSDRTLEKHTKSYINFTLINLLHLQTNTAPFFKIVQGAPLPTDLMNYIEMWCNFQSREPIFLKKMNHLKIFKEFYETVFSGNFKDFLDRNDGNLEFYPEQKQDLFRMLVFYFTRYLECGLEDDHLLNSCQTFLAYLSASGKFNIDSFLGHPVVLNNFSMAHDNRNSAFIVEAIKNLKGTTIKLEHFLPLYREKLVSMLNKVLKKPEKYKLCPISNMLEILGLDYSHCVQILDKIGYAIEKAPDVALLYDILVYSLRQFASLCKEQLNYDPISDEIVDKILQCYVKNNSHQNFNRGAFCSSLLEYFGRFPHNIENVTDDFYSVLLNSPEYNKSQVDLLILLLERKQSLLGCLKENLESIVANKGALLPLLELITDNSRFQNGNLKEILSAVYEKLEPSLLKAIEKPHKTGKYFKSHFGGLTVLIRDFMSVEKVKKIADKIQKFEVSEVFHADFLSAIFEKIVNHDASDKILTNMIITFIHLQMTIIKRLKDDEDKKRLKEISSIFNKFLLKLPQDRNMSAVIQNEDFFKYCLKLGISGESYLLTVLENILRILKETMTADNAKLLVEMILSHSQFLDVVLGDDRVGKVEVLLLFLRLCQNWPEVMERNHVPILLSSYRATMSKSDRILMRLLKMYESANPEYFSDFKPFLWGRAAAVHYSIRLDLQQALFRQPKMGDVLNILQESLINSTIKNYPLSMKLVEDQIKDNVDEKQLDNIYDLVFLLPLFSQLLAPENVVQTYKFTRSGALALSILGLSSDDKDVRAASCHVLSRFYFHVEARQTGKDNLLWLRFIEAICKGTAAVENFQLNNFSVCYLARMAMILTQPKHIMYLPLSQYLAAKPVLDLSGIPELYTFLHSSDVAYKEHRNFIFAILKDGLRTDKDFKVFYKSMAFKLFSELFSSSLCDTETKQNILDVVISLCKLPVAVKTLSDNNSFLEYLYTIIDSLEYSESKKEPIPVLSKLIKILYLLTDAKNMSQWMKTILLKSLLNIVRSKTFDYFQGDILITFYQTVNRLLEQLDTNQSLLHEFNKKNDEYCTYLMKYPCKYTRECDFSDKNDYVYYLRLLFLNRLK